LTAVTAVYVLAGKLGLALATINPSASPVWPPTGIALAAALIFGRAVWPAIFAGAFVVNYTTATGMLPSLGIAVGNTAEALVGMLLVSRFARGRHAFERSGDLFRFIALAGFATTAISATVGTLSVAAGTNLGSGQYSSIWLTWWLGNAAGNVVVAPVILLWARPRERSWTPGQWLEILVCAVAVVTVGALVFIRSSYPIEFLTIPLCVWIGARFGAREAATATALLSAVAVWATINGAGPFARQPPNTGLLFTQLFIVVTQIAGLGIGTALAELTAARDDARRLNDELEMRVSERTAELRTSEARLAEAQGVAHIGSWEWDARTGQLAWSDELFRIYGASPGAFAPSYETFTAMVHADDRARVEQIARQAIVDGEPFEFEFRLLRADGVARMALSRGSAVRDGNGHPLRLVGTLQDITDQKQFDTRLRHAQKLEALGLLAGGIAHDFNNLITAIGGYTEMVLSQLDHGDPRHDDLLEVRKAAERAAALTRRLLAFSRTQSLQAKVVDVNAVVAGLESLLRRTIGEHIELTLTLAQRLDPVRVDPDQLEQVVLNIALNARDAMPGGGQLRFTTAVADVDEVWAQRHPPMTAGRYIRLAIGDTGVGMTPEIQARIFEPFFTTKPHGQGTGFGLATVYGIVNQSGGFINVSSSPACGSVFDIYLPAVAAELDLRPGGLNRVASAAGRGETILLVEDDGAVRRLARDVLVHAGYNVIDARDGEEAMERVRTHPSTLQLVITDVVMPGLSGRELAAKLTARFSGLRVLYTSGYTSATTVATGIDAAAPFLPKPFLPADLVAKVRDVLGGAGVTV
jgi:PAS domain S-box-containing protein